MTEPKKDLRYYCVHVATDAGRERGSPLMLSRPFADPVEASRYGKQKIQDGRASMAFVFRAEGSEKTAMPELTHPRSAKNVIRLYEEFLRMIGELEDE
jgi:alpha-galactosidase